MDSVILCVLGLLPTILSDPASGDSCAHRKWPPVIEERSLTSNSLLFGFAGPLPEADVQTEGPIIECAELFEKRTFKYSGGGYRNESIPYLLFVPELSGEEAEKPLIVWLHGHKERGQKDNKTAHLRIVDEYILCPPWDRESYDFFVLAMQCPADNPAWTTSDTTKDDMINVVAALIEHIIQEYSVDSRRVTLSGVSSGGTASWELAIRRPELFAAVAPLASSGGDLLRVERLDAMSVWAFHNAHDFGDPGPVRQTVAELKRRNGNACLTMIDDEGHNCWTAAFEQFNLLEWLLSQEQGNSTFRPGEVSAVGWLRALKYSTIEQLWALVELVKSYSPLELVGQIGLPLVLIITYRFIRKQQMKGAAAVAPRDV